MTPGVATQHELGHSERRALHEHGSGYPHLLDGHSVELANLDGGEAFRPLVEGEVAREGRPATPDERARRTGSTPDPPARRGVPRTGRDTCSRLVHRHRHGGRGGDGIGVRERDGDLHDAERSGDGGRPPAEDHARAGIGGHLDLEPHQHTGAQ